MAAAAAAGPSSAFESPTFSQTVSITVDDDIGAASISPAGRDVVLASRGGLRIIDLDDPWSLPLFIPNQSSWEVADVQWSPFAARAEWIASTRNQLALVYNLSMPFNSKKAPIEYTLRAHDRAITDINFSAHHPDLLATCGVDSFVFVHDLRTTKAPLKLADYTAGATQVKWNRQNDKIIASAHDKYLHIWDVRRGATPLSTIAAHSTKIYGIDWNRTDPKKILTCSLDSTIKLWSNVGVQATIPHPRRVIRTHYPVWRARHTPFPNGILAMPQRGNSSLWLYKHVTNSSPTTFTNQPAHSFQGHEPDAHVREFLWRTRGSTEDGFDSRDFQLVSWGTDKQLRLHRISPDLLESSVGFKKGERLSEAPSTTRRGATYITYRNGPLQTTTSTARDEYGPPRIQKKGNLSTLLQGYTMGGAQTPRVREKAPLHDQDGEISRETMTAVPIRRNKSRVVTHITWMDGVKFGHKSSANDNRPRTNSSDRGGKNPFQDQNDLGNEISLVGNKYKKLTFEQIDVPGRCIKVSFSGPWGEYDTNTEDNKLVFLRFSIRFPSDYPKATDRIHPGTGNVRPASPLQIESEKTTAAISKEKQDELIGNMLHIAEACADQEREALEAVLSYALGERGLDDSLQLSHDDQSLEDLELLPGAESSSEDDEHDGEFTNDAMQSSHTNANVPTPTTTLARFSACGSLVVARIPPAKYGPVLEAIQLRLARNHRHGPGIDEIFDSFGRFTSKRPDESDGDSSPSSSVGSWEASTSPSSSSGSDDVGTAHIGNFQPPLAWQKAASRFQSKNSLPSSSGTGRQAPKARSIVSILSSAVEDLVPSKRALAEEYRIFGSGPTVCEHNSAAARKHGFQDLADIWALCKLILNNEVPLEIFPQSQRREQVLVLARRALVRIKRKDSGLDLQFDEADNVKNPTLTGRIKWGAHAVASWLVPALFDYFERLADTQMLAMLSCIFAEPAAREGVTTAMANMSHAHLPMSMEAPAFSLDYFPSADAAQSFFKPTISAPSTPAYPRYTTPTNDLSWQRSSKKLGTYGSHGSSNGPWGSDQLPSEPVTPYSTGHTPPLLSRASTIRSAHTASHTPYSTSPEQSHTAIKRSSTAHFASAVAALSRPFANAISSSPPVKSRVEDLSSSAPTGGVTWGTTTVYGDPHERRSLAPARNKHGKRASFGQADRFKIDSVDDSDSDYDQFDEDDVYRHDSISEYTRPITPAESEVIDGSVALKVTLKNQDQFDDEACVSRPLLDMSKDWLHRAWREQYAEMLGCWGLVSARAEVLKFNGLVSYFPATDVRRGSKASSICLAINRVHQAESDVPASRHLSQASTTRASSVVPTQLKHSPIPSPRNFSFNPEATEFMPEMVPFTPAEMLSQVPEVALPTEHHLRLSIPAPTTGKDLDESIAGLGTSPGNNRLHPSRGTRPSLSRGASTVSGSSTWGGGRSPNAVPVPPSSAPRPSEPIYSCSICWIRVSGRFYLCPGCGHVAHFDCMYEELGTDDGECVVGCGCGCGVEEDDERSRMEAYIEEVRAANAAGIAWDESGSWRQVVLASEPPTPGQPSSMYGDFMTGAMSKMSGNTSDKRRERERERVTGRVSSNTSPTPTAKKKDKKVKKKARVSGLSYY